MFNLDKEVTQSDFDVTVFVNRLTSKFLHESTTAANAAAIAVAQQQKRKAPRPPIKSTTIKNPFEINKNPFEVNTNPFESNTNPFDVDDNNDSLDTTTPRGSEFTSSSLANNNQFNLPTLPAFSLDPEKLRINFEKTITELQELQIKYESQSMEMKQQTLIEERLHEKRAQDSYQTLLSVETKFRELDQRINRVGSKVIQLSEQLSGEDKPKERILEAVDVISDFYRFYNGVEFSWAQDIDSTLVAAKRLQKLVSLSLELPDDPEFKTVKQRIHDKNCQLDNALLMDFKASYAKGDLASMRKVVEVFQSSKYFNLCIEAFVKEYLKGIFTQKDLQASILRLANGTESSVTEVFLQSDSVSNRLIQGIFTTPLKNDLSKQLELVKNSPEDYLETLYKNYVSMNNLIQEIMQMPTCRIDVSQLQKYFEELFRHYLTNYMQTERSWLNERFEFHQKCFEEKMGISTRAQANKSAFSEIYREMQVFLNMNVELSQAELTNVLLSQENTLNMLDEIRSAARRCKILSDPSELNSNAKLLFDILVQHLIEGHLRYGIDIALLTIPTTTTGKIEPNIIFFEAVHEANSIFHVFEGTVNDAFGPLLGSFNGEFEDRKKKLAFELEKKINAGMERCLSICIQFIQTLLKNEQKVIDFKPNELAMSSTMMRTQACGKVCHFVTIVLSSIRRFLDGRNRICILHEFLLRFHRILLDHFYTFNYNSYGTYIAMMDVAEYKKTIEDSNYPDPLIAQLFDILGKLINIVAVDPKNLKQIYSDYSELGINKDIFMNFVRLRVDFNSLHLNNVLK